MSVGTLFGNKDNGRVSKPRIIAKLSSISIDYDESFEFMKDNKTPEYLTKFPLGQVPAFESKEGFRLTESNAISFYVANLKENNPILGGNKNDFARINQYMFFADTQIVPAAQDILKAIWGYCPFDKETVDGGYRKLEQGLGYLNKELEGKKFLVGERVTLADVIVGETLGFIYQYILAEELRTKYPELTKYFLAYREMPEVLEVNGPVILAQKLPEVGDSR